MPTIKQFRGNYDKRYYKKEEVDTLLSDGTIDHTNLSNIGVNTHAQIDTFISAMVGALQMYGGAIAPTGWLLCNGLAVSRTTYADLFAIIGTTYGVGDGTTTFNVPNFASKFARGITAGATGGSDDAINVSHAHTFTGNAMGTHGHADTFAFSGSAMGNHNHSQNAHNHGLRFQVIGASATVRWAYNPAAGVSLYTDSATATNIAASAGTPAGSITGSVTAASAGTPAGTNSTEGAAGANKNIPAFLGVNFIIKY